MSRAKLDKSELFDVKQKLEKSVDFVFRKNSTSVELEKEQLFTAGGPHLHQDSENMSESESARFERENPLLFQYLRSLNGYISNIWRS